MTRRYETVYIFDSSLEEAQINERLESYHALLGGASAVEQVSHWGKRTLAFPIRKHPMGYYVLAQFEATPEQLTEYERALRLDESLLRFLTVIRDEEAGLVPAGSAEEGESDDLEEDE